jgi:hypothetical protein
MLDRERKGMEEEDVCESYATTSTTGGEFSLSILSS